MNWEEFRTEIKNLTNKIDFKPDIIVGIVRGGLVPARILSSELKVKEVYAITVKVVSTSLQSRVSYVYTKGNN